MPNEIYHKSNWGNANAEGFGDVYFDAAATNKLYNHSDYYENSWGTDKILRDIPNKASIVLTPTAYSDGSLNTVIPPYQVLPQELVTNGTFDTDSDWVKDTGWTIDNGKASQDGTGTGNDGDIIQVSILDTSKIYKIVLDVVDYTQGTLYIDTSNIDLNVNGIGTYTLYFTPSSPNLFIRTRFSGFIGSIDNVSVKEIQEADFDFSRGSSATRVNEKGLIESIASNLPRIDYTSGFGSLLLEPQRTNLITYSEDFSNSFWLIQNLSVTLNSIISPNGNLNATKLIENTSNSTHRILNNSGLTVSGNVSMSVFAKKGERNWIRLTNNNIQGAFFDLDNGIVGDVNSGINAKIENYGNGWYRCSISQIGVANERLGIYTSIDGVNTTYQGDGTSGVYIWGAQCEVGDYATSYIVSNSGSATTRSADVANNSGNADLFNDSEGVLYAEVEFVDDATSKLISINDNSSSNRILFGNFSDGNFKVYSQSSDLIVVSGLTGNNKIAAKYKSGDFSLFVNGVEIGTSTSTVLPTGLSELSFDNGSGGSIFYGKTKELAVFKEALTDAELESLTSWVSFTEMATDLEYTLE